MSEMHQRRVKAAIGLVSRSFTTGYIRRLSLFLATVVLLSVVPSIGVSQPNTEADYELPGASEPGGNDDMQELDQLHDRIAETYMELFDSDSSIDDKLDSLVDEWDRMTNRLVERGSALHRTPSELTSVYFVDVGRDDIPASTACAQGNRQYDEFSAEFKPIARASNRSLFASTPVVRSALYDVVRDWSHESDRILVLAEVAHTRSVRELAEGDVLAAKTTGIATVRYSVIDLYANNWIRGSYDYIVEESVSEDTSEWVEHVYCPDVLPIYVTELIRVISGFVHDETPLDWDAVRESRADAPASIREPDAFDKNMADALSPARGVVKVIVPLTVYGSSASVGTGFSILPDLVLTNHHIIAPDGEPRLFVELTNVEGMRASGVVVGFDPNRNLALVRSTYEFSDTIRLHDGSDLQIGEDVAALGYRRFLASRSRGIVNGFVKEFDGLALNGVVRFRHTGLIVTDATINKGNSGGPLMLIKNGRIHSAVGVNAWSAGSLINMGFDMDLMADLEGLNLAISSSEVISFLEEEGFSVDESGLVHDWVANRPSGS